MLNFVNWLWSPALYLLLLEWNQACHSVFIRKEESVFLTALNSSLHRIKSADLKMDKYMFLLDIEILFILSSAVSIGDYSEL